MDVVSVSPNRRSVENITPALLHEAGTAEEELEGFIRVYRDGSVERFSYVVSNVPPSDKPGEPVASKDVVVDADTRVWARLYLPADNQRGHGKLPLVIYFHGGGFVIGSPAWSIYHAFMCRLACEINSVIISVGYRLAPEHRLPAAYDDCFSAVEWVRRQAAGVRSVQTQNPKEPEESWMTTYCDFSRCFLAGDSAGGNIAHHVAMRAAKTDVKPPSTKC
jgi:acetyl esterase/lipase